MQHYLDNAATTQVAQPVIETVCDTLKNHWANPSSLYAPGYEAEQVITKAREILAGALGCESGQVYFTGSGTEGSNIAIFGAARARRAWAGHLVATGYEHPAVAAPLRALEEQGFALTLVNPGADGRVDAAALVDAVTDKTALVCAMQVNNETGAVLDVAALAKAVKEKNHRTGFHVDGVQGFCKLPPLGLANTAIDSYAVSGHKLHAPKGVGALYLRRGYNIKPLPLVGGGQEEGIRPGTQNTAYIAGFGKAVELAQKSLGKPTENIQKLRARLLAGLSKLEGIRLNSPEDGYAGILNFSLPGVRSETMLHFLEGRGVYVSSGSACSRGAASHTLRAMGLPAERVDSALRASFDGENTEEDIDALLAGLADGLQSLARARRT